LIFQAQLGGAWSSGLSRRTPSGAGTAHQRAETEDVQMPADLPEMLHFRAIRFKLF